METTMVPTEQLDMSNWWTALQTDSVLASCHADCLQHIFTRLAFFDALSLAYACHRLYFYFKACQKRTKTLRVKIGNYIFLFKKDFSISNILNAAPKLASTYTNLQTLIVTTTLSPYNFATLLAQLTSMPKLTTFNIHVRDFDVNFSNVHLNNHLWSPLSQLQHSSLRDLTLKLQIDSSRDDYEIPPLPILSQLTSFTVENIGSNFSPFYKIIRALTNGQHGVHLIPGVSARFVLKLFGYKYHEVTLEPDLLPFVICLKVSIGEKNQKTDQYDLAMVSLFRYLPQMRNLQKVMLTVYPEMNCTDYPSFLSALSSLPHLREFTMIVEWIYLPNTHSLLWPRSSMPVLPRVHSLSLIYQISNHTDVVEQFHLAHCFPHLRQLYCNFQHCQDACDTNKCVPYLSCGQKLAQGLLKLMPKTIVKKITFTFHYRFTFNSLNDLIYFKQKELLKATDRILSSDFIHPRKSYTQLEAENELLREHLAQLNQQFRVAISQEGTGQIEFAKH